MILILLRGGGLYYILLYTYIVRCTHCVVERVSMHGKATIILYQKPSYTRFLWLHYNETITGGNASTSWSCNSTKYVITLRGQCCDLTIMDVQAADLGDYTLHVWFSDSETTKETVVLVWDLSSTATAFATKGTITPILIESHKTNQELHNTGHQCTLFFGIVFVYTVLFNNLT
ncbi:membrane protein EE53 [Elephantid betaherpesvirus 1]|uniref:Membrane protein EE53 n=1 Tax=Elephantid herpesvirus 1 TaxID=146015 RepID=M4JYV4_ELHV1|nr:membrane protein EE53 [Elephantid betaherpesvirus 1]